MKNINSFIKSHCGFGGISSVSRRYLVLLTTLLSLGVGQMWGASVTFYVAVGENHTHWDNACRTFYSNIKRGDNNWEQIELSRTDYTYNGKTVYQGTHDFSYGGYNNWQFYIKDGSGNNQKYLQWYAGDWKTDLHNGEVWDWTGTEEADKSEDHWKTATWDDSYKVYFARTTSWDYGTPYFYGWNGNCDNNAWPGTAMDELSGKTFNGKKIYTITVGKRYANCKFSNNGSNETGNFNLYGTNDGKMYYWDGSADQWVTLQYDVTLDRQNGTTGSTSIVATCGSAMPSATMPTRSGYTFAGYYTGTSGSGTKYYNADGSSAATWPSNGTGPTTLYAYWTQDPGVATLTAAGNATELWIGENPSSALTFTATSSNVSSGTAVTWSASDNSGGTCTVTSSSYAGATITYTPATTGAKTLTVTMTIGGNNYTRTYNLTVYERWNIYVQNNCSWGKGIALYMFDNGTNGDWPGVQGTGTGCESYGTKNWYKVTLDSKYPKFILDNKETNSGIEQSSDITMNKAVQTANSYWYFVYSSESDGKKFYTLTKYTLSNPTVALSVSVANCKDITLTGTISNFGGYGSKASEMEEVYFQVGGTKQSAGTVSSSDGTFSKTISSATAGATNTLQAFAENIHSTGSSSTLHYTNVTLNPQGGADGTTSVTAVENTAMPAGATAPSKTGYTFDGYYASADGSGKKYYTNTMASANTWDQTTTDATIHAQWTAKTYTVTLDQEGGSSGSENVTMTYDASTHTTITNPTKTGYTFGGYWTGDNGTGTLVIATDGTLQANVSGYTGEGGIWTKDATCTLYAKWTAKSYTVTLDKQTEAAGHSADGTAANPTVTYNGACPAISGTLPTAAQGYAFMGFYTATNGNGKQVIDHTGAWVASVTGYTDESKNWIHDGNVTLYAHYRQAAITALNFAASTVAPGGEVSVTPVISPAASEGTIQGPIVVCWRVLYSNDNPLADQPTFTPADGNTVSFTAPADGGTYKIEAKLHIDDCDGTLLSTQVISFQVATDHIVTVQYKCGSEIIAPSTTVNGKPLEWTEVVAHEIFGYTFSSWTAGDGITLRDTTPARLTELRAEDPTIVAVKRMKAIYDGRLTANYTKKDFIYFKNTLKWSGDDIHVYFYKSSGYWNETKGAGATGDACIGKGKMNLVPGETDIYYWDYSGITGGASAATQHVAFTNVNKMSQDNFYECKVVYPTKGGNEGFSTGTPMFIPISQEKVTYNTNADYYNKGYWTKYAGGTGYSVDIFYANGSYDKSINFEEGESEGMPYTANVYLNGGSNLYFKVHRSSNIYYYSTANVTMSNATTSKALTYDSSVSHNTTITTNVAGDYIFTLTCGSDGKLNVTVKYPAAAGDYRLVYSDGVQTKPLVSDVVPQVNGGKDTVSFFVRPDSIPVLKIQQASVSAGVLSWGDYSTVSNELTAARCPQDSVYNICLQMDGSGNISVENVEAYTGNFYIRTDAANNKWDNYRAADHMMTYSEYSEHNSDFTHYWMKFVGEGTNIKFVVANDYSPNISDTLARQTYRGGDDAHVGTDGKLDDDLPGDGVNIRFMWHRHTNAVTRAYLAPAQNSGSEFLVLQGQADELLSESGTALASGNNNGAPDNSIQFTDNENWIYETNVQVKPSSYVKLYGYFHGTNFYFKGKKDSPFNGDKDGEGIPNAIQLVTGDSETPVAVRVIYDFKTDRLIAALLPYGNYTDSTAINADVMFIREHQGDIRQLTFSGNGEIAEIKTAYGVMRFNKWTLNNKSTADGHAPLASPASIYERSLYFISFPFRVKLSEVFGFGTYGTHWAIQRYNGARRAAEGFWAESTGFWEWMNRDTAYLYPDQGYLLAIDLDLLGENSDVWGPGSVSSRIELFFPSYGKMPNITSEKVRQKLPAHACTIDRSGESNGNGGTLGDAYNRTVIDSHWNVMAVPTYVNTNNIEFANTAWITDGDKRGPNFLYTWNSSDNTLTPTAGASYTYKAMHAYMVQYYDSVIWNASSGSPYSPIVARRTYAEQPQKVNFCLEIQQNEQMIDRTYVQLSNDEETSSNFAFGEDMGKEFNSRKANIYTVVENYLPVAGNTLPMGDGTTVVPVGVKIRETGEFTFAMPEGTSGIGVTLIDNETGSRTSLSALEYTVSLNAGEYTNRFFLEISPVQNSTTDIEAVSGQPSEVRKVMIDGILYIVRDGKMYDARGTRVK